jgi:hypothetical protein
MKNQYLTAGIAISVLGALLAPVFYFVVGSAPLTATAISALIIGVTCIAIANARPYLSPEAAQLLLKTGIDNTASLLEELALSNRAIYIPSNGTGKVKAIVPLSRQFEVSNLHGEARNTTPGETAGDSTKAGIKMNRLIVRYGPNAEDMAISVSTAGTFSVEMLEDKPGPNANDIEAALNHLFSGVLDIASGSTVTMADGKVKVIIKDSRMGYENVWYYRSLGSPVASITAAVIAEATGKPVRISSESQEKGNCQVEVEVLG